MSKPGETDWGKGSFPRTWNTDSFRINFDQIDWSEKQGPPYSYGSLGEEMCLVCGQPMPCPWQALDGPPQTISEPTRNESQ